MSRSSTLSLDFNDSHDVQDAPEPLPRSIPFDLPLTARSIPHPHQHLQSIEGSLDFDGGEDREVSISDSISE